jgi:imidazolonepropionase-like amidohydrolase
LPFRQSSGKLPPVSAPARDCLHKQDSSMTKIIRLLAFFCLAFTASAAQPKPLAITHVTVIDLVSKAPLPDQTVIINGDRITALGPAKRVKVPAEAEVIDATGKFLIPGLWDMHLHLTNQPDQTISRELLLPLLIAFGVTGVREMGGDWERLQQLRQAIATGQVIGPRIIAAGPFVDGPGFIDKPVRSADEARQRVRELKTLGVDFIKVQANLSPDSYRAVLAEAKQLGLAVAGHVPEAARSGQVSIEHSSPILPGDAGLLLACSSKEAGLRAELLALKAAAEQPNTDRQQLRVRERALQTQLLDSYDTQTCTSLAALLKQNNVAVVPTQVWAQRLVPLNAEDGANPAARPFIPAKTLARFEERRAAGIKATTPGTFALRQMIADKTRELVGALRLNGVRLLAGTDALDGDLLPGLSLHQELELMVRSGLTPLEALQTATRNAVQFLGEDQTGNTLSTGKPANLVLLDANPLQEIGNTRKIHAVVYGGKLLTAAQRQELLTKLTAVASQH